ncbi:hypothetical protein [Pedobacter psychroterrae]|uniref:Uncharacterized protein n=1 Tax=Pedobacter psychroterrae TaxID=2530453 RepID=A0A4V2MLX6_9SPHI|nr:hypothetical protein [Pedobacter psychroterrae]TCD03767.1 hypothetical protein EZ437_07390 [Pedobacter psychroterrae]
MINQSNIFKKIGYILNELQDQYQFLSENPEQLSELELELFLANANFLSDHVEIVRKLNNSKTTKELPQHVEISKDDIIQPIQQEEIIHQEQPLQLEQPLQALQSNDNLLIEEIEREELHQDDLPPAFEFVINENPPTDRFDFEEKSVVDMFDRTLSKEEELIIAEKQRLTEAPEPVFTPTAANTFTSPQRPTLNDLLAGKNNSNNLAEENAKPPITDLKRAITLNEKLLYIKDLFNGYNLAYSEAIDLINKMPDLQTADTFLKNNYAIKNNWEVKQSTVSQFYELLKQRFPED